MSAARLLLAPRYWVYHLVVVAALVAAGLLGLWQYDGWQERRAVEARDLTQGEPIPLADAIGADDPFPGSLVGQPVEVRGSWVPDATAYVSGREHHGRDGYWVVGFVAVGGSLLPVVRGWVASVGDVPAPSGSTDLVGWLQPSEACSPPTRIPRTRCCPSCAWPTWRSASTRTCTAATSSSARGVPTTAPTGWSPPISRAAGRRTVHGLPQPAVCRGVVVLRLVRGVRVVAVGTGGDPGGRRCRGPPGSRGDSR